MIWRITMITNLFLTIFEKSISTSIIIFTLLTLSSFFNRRYAAKWKYFIWIALALHLTIPLNIDLSLPKLVINLPAKLAAPITSSENGIPIILEATNKTSEIAILDIIAVLWLTGCFLFLFIHMSSFYYYKSKIIKTGTKLNNSYISNQVFKLSGDLHINQDIQIIQYSDAESPMIIGFFKPILVLPDNNYSVNDLFFILKHELIHLKRHDIFYKLLFVCANAMHWFNPLIYIMQKDAVVDMELSCDERVLQGTAYTVRKVYTETLFSTIRRQYKKSTCLTTEFYGGKEVMKKRFINILDRTKKKNGFAVLSCIICATLLLGMTTGCSIQDYIPDKVEGQTQNITPDISEEIATTTTEVLEQSKEKQLSTDAQIIQDIVEKFAAAYFYGDGESMAKYLTDSIHWELITYEGNGDSVCAITLKGLEEIKDTRIDDVAVVSLEYKTDANADTFQYLTIELVKQTDGWKIQYYGMEG